MLPPPSGEPMPPPPPMAPPPPRAAMAFVRGDDLSSVSGGGGGLTRPLPRDWQAVASKSRPGETSYVHLPTGLKQARFPESAPTPEQIRQHNEAVRAAKERKRSRQGAAPLLKHAPTANWQKFSQKKGRTR